MLDGVCDHFIRDERERNRSCELEPRLARLDLDGDASLLRPIGARDLFAQTPEIVLHADSGGVLLIVKGVVYQSHRTHPVGGFLDGLPSRRIANLRGLHVQK